MIGYVPADWLISRGAVAGSDVVVIFDSVIVPVNAGNGLPCGARCVIGLDGQGAGVTVSVAVLDVTV